MRVFVTGGSGFVGGHLIEGLVRAGHTVSAMARSTSSRAVVEGYGATAIRCDLDTVAATDLAGHDAVIHAAAHVAEYGPYEVFYQNNVVGTERLLARAATAGIRRFVWVGTEAAVFDGHDLRNIDESAPYPDPHPFVYGATKALAEQRVITANTPSMTTIVIRPRLVWDPRDVTVLPAVLSAARAGRFAWIDHGHALTSTCHVMNLVDALILALDHGRGGQVYFVADEGIRSYRVFFDGLARAAGETLPARSIPGWVARPLSRWVEWAWRTLKISSNPPITAMPVHMLAATMTLCTDKAKRELGWTPQFTP